MKNCIFICIFGKESYLQLGFLLLESIGIFGGLAPHTDILIYTTTRYRDHIMASHLHDKDRFVFETCDDKQDLLQCCAARYDLFDLQSIGKYENVLYLDTDILIQNDISFVPDIPREELLYVTKEGRIDDINGFWGGPQVFGLSCLLGYIDKTGFSSGVLLFKNCPRMKTLFENTKDSIDSSPNVFQDQPFINYNAYKLDRMINNDILPLFATNECFHTSLENFKNYSILHFSGDPGNGHRKIDIMGNHLRKCKDDRIMNNITLTRSFINIHFLKIIHESADSAEGKRFMLRHTSTYTDPFINKTKNVGNVVLNAHVRNVLEIGYNAGFSALLMLISNPNVRVTIYDPQTQWYTPRFVDKMREFFGSRVEWISGDTTDTLPGASGEYDLVHIDGVREVDVLENDIVHSYRMSRPGTIMVMDNYNDHALRELWDRYIHRYALRPLDIHLYETADQDIMQVTAG